jgi:hypothetical protein
MTTSIAGAGFVLHPGDEREFPDAEAMRLIAAEYAIPVAERKIERAVSFDLAAEMRRDEPRRRGRPRSKAA